MSKGWAAFWMFVLLVPSWLWHAYVATTLWRWFAVPIGAPHIGVATMMGLGCIVGLYRGAAAEIYAQKQENANKTGGEIFGEFVGKASFGPAFVLLVGWLITKAM